MNYSGQIQGVEVRQQHGSAGMSDKPSPARAPQISTELEILEKELSINRDAIERLGNKMQPVLSLGPPEPAGELGNNEPTCPMAAAIQRLRNTVGMHTKLIEQLASRLEV